MSARRDKLFGYTYIPERRREGEKGCCGGRSCSSLKRAVRGNYADTKTPAGAKAKRRGEREREKKGKPVEFVSVEGCIYTHVPTCGGQDRYERETEPFPENLAKGTHCTAI